MRYHGYKDALKLLPSRYLISARVTNGAELSNFLFL